MTVSSISSAGGAFARRVGVAKLAELAGVPPAPAEAVNELNQRLRPVFSQAVAEASPW